MKVNFTKAVLDGHQAPPHPHRLVICDLGQPGLRIRVTSGGIKTFSVIYRWEGQQRRDGCGKWGTVSIKQARDKARQILAAASLGDDPRRATAVLMGARVRCPLAVRTPG